MPMTAPELNTPAAAPAPDAQREGPVLIDPPQIPSHACSKHRHCEGWVKTRGAGTAARVKTGFLFAALLLAFAGLGARLVQIQVFQSADWKKRMPLQSVATQRPAAERGPIFLNMGAGQLPIALNEPRVDIIADLHVLNGRDNAAKQLAPLIGAPPEQIFKQLNRDDTHIVYLFRNMEPDRAEKIRALKIRGIGFEDTFVRSYPQGKLACHLIGYAGMDGGQEGLERGLERVLRGQPGALHFYRDASGRLIAVDGDILAGSAHPPIDGSSVELTIDARMQEFAEEQLAQIHEEFDPKSATLILMDPTNGAILAIAATPAYDPRNPAASPADSRRCRPFTDFYEPGSTFKTIFASEALEHNRWRRSEIIFCENGAWRLPQRTLHDSHAYGFLAFDEVIIKSSNIGAAKICQRFTLQEMYNFVRDFGFGEPTGLNFPGESKGMVRPANKWTADSRYSVAMGHEIGVTPVQLATAFCAVVNGGTLYRPRLVQRVTDENGKEIYTLRPQPLRRVISEHTSREMRDILSRVVMPGGTGVKAFMPEWPSGGKTATTKKLDPQTHTYSSTLYIGSFCGFAPVENPRLVCLVTVDEPRKGAGYYGGTVACPSVREMLRKGLTLLNVPPRNADEQEKAIRAQRTVSEH